MGVNDQINPTLEKNQNIKMMPLCGEGVLKFIADIPGKYGMRVNKSKPQGDQKLKL